eukprot:3121848-Rhodomonas_salina.4
MTADSVHWYRAWRRIWRVSTGNFVGPPRGQHRTWRRARVVAYLFAVECRVAIHKPRQLPVRKRSVSTKTPVARYTRPVLKRP